MEYSVLLFNNDRSGEKNQERHTLYYKKILCSPFFLSAPPILNPLVSLNKLGPHVDTAVGSGVSSFAKVTLTIHIELFFCYSVSCAHLGNK